MNGDCLNLIAIGMRDSNWCSRIGVCGVHCRWGLKGADISFLGELFGEGCVCIVYPGEGVRLPGIELKNPVHNPKPNWGVRGPRALNYLLCLPSLINL